LSTVAIVQTAKIKDTGDFQTYLLEIKRPKQDFPFKFRIPYDIAIEFAEQILLLDKIRHE
jgi:hypothetical protein